MRALVEATQDGSRYLHFFDHGEGEFALGGVEWILELVVLFQQLADVVRIREAVVEVVLVAVEALQEQI